MYKLTITIMLALILIVSSVAAAPAVTPTLPTGQVMRITSEVGESYVQWSWTAEGVTSLPPLTIVLDDEPTPTVYNYTSSTLLANELSSGRHTITIYNSTDYINGTYSMIGKATTQTQKPAYQIYGLMAIAIALMLLVFVLTAFSNIIYLVMVSIFNIGICLFGMAISFNSGVVPYLFIGIASVVGLTFIISALPRIREEIAWY